MNESHLKLSSDRCAGIQIHEPVAGVAIGLVSKCAEDGSVVDHRVLTDILVDDLE